MNFYPHHIKDFNNSTRHLTRVERSVYRDAIELYYDTEQALTSDLVRLGKRLLCFDDAEKQALSDVLDEYFELSPDGYFHERCDLEIAKYRTNISSKAKAGIASAAARKKKAAERKQKSTRVEQPLNSVEQTINQEPLTINQEVLKDNVELKPDTDPVLEIFEYWQEKLNHPQAKFDDDRKKLIKKALKQWGVDQIKLAIYGMSVTPHNIGINDSKQRYDGLHIVFKNANNFERFMANGKNPNPPIPLDKHSGFKDRDYSKGATNIEDLTWASQ